MRKVGVRKDQATLDFIQQTARQQPKAKGVGKKKGKMTREESARILGIKYDGNDEYDD